MRNQRLWIVLLGATYFPKVRVREKETKNEGAAACNDVVKFGIGLRAKEGIGNKNEEKQPYERFRMKPRYQKKKKKDQDRKTKKRKT